MEKLYIIGNGFDMHHGLKTSYLDYAKYIKSAHFHVYEALTQNFPLTDIEDHVKWDPLWARFEASLGDLYTEEIMDKYSDYVANPGADDFKDGDWDTIAIYIEQEIDDLLKGLKMTFTKFISSVEFPILDSQQLVKIDSKSRFINFNYTETLELYYNINRDDILYIHNRSGESENLLLGHAVEEPDLFPEPKMPEGLTDEEKEDWKDYQSDNYDLSIQRGQWEIENYFSKSLKNTKEILKLNYNIFKELHEIKEIFVFGHSISEVDQPYFETILRNLITLDAKWTVSYYSEDSIPELLYNLMNVGVKESNIQMVKLNEIVL